MQIQIKHRYSGAVLFGGDFDCLASALVEAVRSRADLSGANLSWADLSRADLSGANLSGSNLYGANLSGSNLSRANLYGANLSGANLYGSNLSWADLSRADLSGANLSRADLSGANLSRSNLSGSNLSGSNLYGADLSRSNLYGANLYGADLSRSNLSGSNLSGANLSGADLYGSNLSGSNLYGANLSGADLSGADLSGAKLSGSKLSGSNLSRADLSGANLSGASLYGADGINKYFTTDLYLLKDQPGAIRSYKLVKSDGEGNYAKGNGHTPIVYEQGGYYEIDNANTDETQQCGAGISLCSLPWALREWKDGYRVLIAEHFAEDIAAIPIGSDGKYRVHRCQIVGEKAPERTRPEQMQAGERWGVMAAITGSKPEPPEWIHWCPRDGHVWGRVQHQTTTGNTSPCICQVCGTIRTAPKIQGIEDD